MIWGLIIYILGILVSLWLSYRFSESMCSIIDIIGEVLFSLFSWVYVLFLLVYQFGDKKIRIKNINKSNKLKVR